MVNEVIWYCPFCQKQTIKVIERPAFRGVGKARGSGRTSSFSTYNREEYTILTGCSNCGKPLEEVKKALGY